MYFTPRVSHQGWACCSWEAGASSSFTMGVLGPEHLGDLLLLL